MNKVKNILYLGWLGKGNVGDDVLYELFKSMFYKYYNRKDKNIEINIDGLTVLNNYKVDVVNYDLIVLGGGSLIQHSYFLGVCKEAINNGIPVVSWGTGVDGYYGRDYLDSISIIGENSEEIISLYDQFELLSVRGPFTKNILVNSGLKKEVHEIGDPALVYSMEMYGEEFDTTYKKNILINWGTSYNNIFGGNELDVEDELVTVVKELILQDYTVTVYPIWTEDIEPVKRLVEKVNDKRCQIITEVYEAKVLQKIISRVYMTINFKLHANILSAAANRPFISLAYRGKCFDFSQTVNCQEYTVSTDQVSSESILNLVKSVESNYSDIVNRLKEAKEKYYPRVISSIKKISNLLEKNISIKDKVLKNCVPLLGKDELHFDTTLKNTCLQVLNSIAGFKKNTKNLNDMYDQLSEYIFRLTEKEKNKGIEDYLETLHLVIKNYLTGKVSYSSFIHYINRQFGIEIDKVEKALSYIGKEKYEKTSKGNSTLPKVSIIIPTYNRKGYLEQSINSILMQDYPNIEIIVMDDGSTDGTNEMMKKKFVQDPSITYKRRKYNEGPSKNRKEAFELYAEGEYVIFLDDDDYLIDNDYLYKAVNFHINNPNVSFVAANVFFYNMKSNKWNLSNLNFDKIIDKHEYFLNFQKEEYPKPIPSITVFKRSSLIEMEIGNMKSVNDVSIFLRALLAGDAGFIDTIAGVYRVHGNNITFNLTPDFIIDNLDEKLVIKNIAINKYGYSIKEMEEWMDYMSFNTMFYFITNSARNLTDIKEMYLWATKNTPNIVNRIGFKRLIEKWIRIDSETQGIFRMSYDLIETILEGLSYVINLSEDQAEKVILMLNDVSIGFVSIKEAIVPIVERIDEYTLHNRIGLLQQTLERILNDNNIENIIEITQSTLEPLFNELRNEIKFYLLITIE